MVASISFPSGQAEPVAIVVGIDIGGTGTRFAVFGPNREILRRGSVETPGRGAAVDAFLIDQVERITAGFRLQSIGIGASGPIDVHGTIQNPDTLPAFTGVALTSTLSTHFGVPVVIDNDAACAAVAEHAIGAGQGKSSLVHVTLGTGIGVAVLVDGVALRGSDGEHPEAGHISVSGSTTRCYCGRASCWEQAASRQTLQRTASLMLGLAPTEPTAVDALANRASNGDARAMAAFDHYGTRVADGLATLLAIYRPQAVILGGSGARHLALYRGSLLASLESLGDWISSPTLLGTQLDDFGGAVGGAIMAERLIGRHVRPSDEVGDEIGRP